MKKFFTFMGVAALAIQGAFALITIPTSFPLAKVNGNTASGKDQLSLLVSRYENDVVLLVNPPEAYSKEIQAVVAAPATMERLKAMGTSGGAKLTADSLASAVTAMVRQSPASAPEIVASAIALLKSVPGGQSPENREKIARAAIQGIPDDYKEEPKLIAFIIGVSAQGLGDLAAANLVRSLRNFSVGDTTATTQPTAALAVDQALVDEGILSPFAATPEFLVLADAYNFASDQLGETFFSGDQGVINQGAVIPGAPGSAGGSGSSGNQIQPTPTPQPPPAS